MEPPRGAVVIVHFEDAPSPPACWNRPEFGPEFAWASQDCGSWKGVGIGQPTAEYPSGTPYPIAHGWLPWCKQCDHMPQEQR